MSAMWRKMLQNHILAFFEQFPRARSVRASARVVEKILVSNSVHKHQQIKALTFYHISNTRECKGIWNFFVLNIFQKLLKCGLFKFFSLEKFKNDQISTKSFHINFLVIKMIKQSKVIYLIIEVHWRALEGRARNALCAKHVHHVAKIQKKNNIF